MTDADSTLNSIPLIVASGSPTATQCSVSVLDVEGDQVSVQYTGLPGNQPHTFGNFIGVWEGSIIGFGSAPIAQTPIPENYETGSVVVDTTITYSSYTVAYSLGTAVTDLCASQLIGAGGQLGPAQAVSMVINNIGPTSVSIAYSTLPGYMPANAGNWVGLWLGEIDPYEPGDPVATAKVTSNANADNLAIMTPLGIKETYTLVYFMGPAGTTAAVTLTFNTDQPS
jgi:hypothetical protein